MRWNAGLGEAKSLLLDTSIEISREPELTLVLPFGLAADYRHVAARSRIADQRTLRPMSTIGCPAAFGTEQPVRCWKIEVSDRPLLAGRVSRLL